MTALAAFMASQMPSARADSSRPATSSTAPSPEFAPKEAKLEDKCQGGTHGNLTYQELLDTQLQYVSWVLKTSKDQYPGNWGVAMKQLAFNLKRFARINEEGLVETFVPAQSRQSGHLPDHRKIASAINTLLTEDEEMLMMVGHNAVRSSGFANRISSTER